MRRGMPYHPPARKDSASDDSFMTDEASHIHIGDRCEVECGAKRGIVRYVWQSRALLVLGYSITK